MSDVLSADDVETPVGVVDLDVVRANAERVADYAASHGMSWRPHIKTHKSREIARIQLAAGASGLTVATLREAEVMSGLTTDLLLAYPPIGAAKVRRLGAVLRLAEVLVALDSTEALSGVDAAAGSAGRQAGVLVEADVGLGRVGVATPSDVVALAKEAESRDGTFFAGLMFYPGHIRQRKGDQDAGLAEVSGRVARTLAALSDAGLATRIVSGGSTPTLWNSHRIGGLTEIRSGSCIFFDREGVEVGVAAHGEIAYTVLSTVVSTAVRDRAVVDAGSKALAKEGRGGSGFGFVYGRPDVLVSALSEEHGTLDLSGTDWRPSIGDRVRLVPNHVCVSVNLQDRLLAPVEAGYRVVSTEARGRGPWTG